MVPGKNKSSEDGVVQHGAFVRLIGAQQLVALPTKIIAVIFRVLLPTIQAIDASLRPTGK